jgi:RES domain
VPTSGEVPGEELPPPPADLRDRRLPITEEDGPWTRMHPVEHDPVFFRRTGLNRFDDPRGEYGVLYAAKDAFGAFIESFGRTPGRNVVSWEKLRSRPLSSIEAERLLRLVDLTGGGLARLGATAEIFTDDYEKAQEWSCALHDHPSKPDGLSYRLKHDPSRVGVAIFDRAGTLRARSLGTMIAPEHEKLLAAILKEYGFGLVGGPPVL